VKPTAGEREESWFPLKKKGGGYGERQESLNAGEYDTGGEGKMGKNQEKNTSLKS